MTETASLNDLLDKIGGAAPGEERVSLADVMNAFGGRSFGPLLLTAGLITISPIGDIPGVPTTIALFVLLMSAQLLFGRRQFWLPQWLLKRSVTRPRLDKTLAWTRKPARFVDRLLRRRMTIFVEGPALVAIGGACIVVAICTPPLELVPFTGTAAGLALCGFGLALTAHDGLVALLSFLFTGVAIGLGIYHLLG
jgi:hypothetical protein